MCYPHEKETEMVIFTNLNPKKIKGWSMNTYPPVIKEPYPTKSSSQAFPPNKQEMLFPLNSPKAMLT